MNEARAWGSAMQSLAIGIVIVIVITIAVGVFIPIFNQIVGASTYSSQLWNPLIRSISFIFPLIVGVMFIFGIVSLFFNRERPSSVTIDGPLSPVEVAKQRYINGETDKIEFEQELEAAWELEYEEEWSE